MKLQTPEWNLSGVEEEVYEPAEDTFLLLDVLEMELEWIMVQKPSIVVEVGCGSGVIITALSKVLSNSFCFATDINVKACITTSNTSALNNTQVDVLEMDLLDGLRDGMVDLLVFNPPYVLTEPEEIEAGRGINRSWAGGCQGRQVMDRLFPHLPRLLSQNACFYLIVIDENCPDGISSLLSDLGFKGSVIKSRQVRGEHLSVMKFIKIL